MDVAMQQDGPSQIWNMAVRILTDGASPVDANAATQPFVAA
jgi:hypothetical protein